MPSPGLAILVTRGSPLHARALREIESAARALGLQSQVVEIRDPDELDKAFASLTAARLDAIFVPADSMFYQHRGGLMAYATNLDDLARRAATFVDKILRGAKPADLPVEQPTKFELLINVKTAKALRLTIPSSLLLRADQVIE